MIKKIQKNQIKTYKDIVIENTGDENFYQVDEKKEKELLEREKKLKENKKLLIKVLLFFVMISFLYLFITRVVYKFRKDPVYFSNIFIQKIQVDKRYNLKITNYKKQINIGYLKKFFEKIDTSNGYLNVLYLTEKIDNKEKNLSSQDFLLNIDSSFGKNNIKAFNDNFAISEYTMNDNPYYFAFFDVKNYSLTNKYMIVWENSFLDKISKNKDIKGFLTKTINNKKARILVDTKGNEIFGYAFVDGKTLVFFDNSKAFSKIVNRIIVSI